jgi:hypothetical protein
MARFASAYRTTGPGTLNALATASLLAQANIPLWVTEIWVTNTTTTAFSCCVRRIVTSAGTPGAAQTVNYEESDTATVRGDPRDTHTVAPTYATGAIRNAAIGASVGSGTVFTFGGRGLFIPAGATNGVAVLPLIGTGQIIDVSWSWDV